MIVYPSYSRFPFSLILIGPTLYFTVSGYIHYGPQKCLYGDNEVLRHLTAQIGAVISNSVNHIISVGPSVVFADLGLHY